MAETATTLHALIQAGADEATALSSPGGVPLTFGALRALTESTIASLNAQGIGVRDVATTQSSLEEVFMSLLENGAEARR